MEKTKIDSAKFNSSAYSYDDDFTNSNIGKLQRGRVYYWLNKLSFFSVSKKVFEINCGTGYDAELFYKNGHQIIATDISEKMIAFSKQERNQNIDFQIQSFKEVLLNKSLPKCNVLFSNFGGLNCITNDELSLFLKKVSIEQKNGSQLILVLMSKKCLMESIYFFLKRDFSKINRRKNKVGIDVNVKNEKVRTYYYLPKDIETMLSPNYKINLVKPIAIFLPPSYLEPFFKKRKTLLHILNKLEQIFGRFTYLAKWADHYIIVAEKQ